MRNELRRYAPVQSNGEGTEEFKTCVGRGGAIAAAQCVSEILLQNKILAVKTGRELSRYS
jgi:hypothetical protein